MAKEEINDDISEEQEEEQEGKSGTGGSKTILIIIVAAFVLFMAMAGAGFYIIWQKIPTSSTENVKAKETLVVEKQPTDAIGPIHSLDPFVVNLADSTGKRFLRVQMSLELKDQGTADQIKLQLPRIKDKILTILSAKKFQDISTVKGKSDLRTEIAASIDAFFSKGAVTNIYFSEFVIE